jgi:hypothetical protein
MNVEPPTTLPDADIVEGEAIPVAEPPIDGKGLIGFDEDDIILLL